MTTRFQPQVHSREVVYANPWFEVQAKRGTGFDQPYYVLSTADYVTIVPVSESGEIVFVRQYRPAVEAFTLELPSGHIEQGESPEAAARRELIEETGYEALDLAPLGPLLADTGRMGNHLWAFSARVRKTGAPEAGIELVLRPAASLNEMIASGQLEHALDLAVLTKARVSGHLRP